MNEEEMITGDPQVLYRYRHLKDAHQEWTRQILTESVLHFAKPSTFNDPFDCRVHFRPSFSEKKLMRKYSALVSENMPQLNSVQRQAKVAADLKAIDSQGLLSFMTRRLQNKVNKAGIL